MRKFLNPYHFVPVAPKPMDPTADATAGVELPSELHHDRYVAGTRSGRIICRLTAVTPIVVGGSQTPADRKPTTVEPYRAAPVENGNQAGAQPAIPASTLRGMFSSLVEAASNSALRILEKDWPGGGGIEIKWPDRNGVPGPREFFKAVGADLVPLTPARTTITAAERVFGYVEEDPPANRPARALASRIRFADGLVREGVKVVLDRKVKLRILASPKPPSPSFYFLKGGDLGVARAAFIPRGSMLPSQHLPRGRKLFFHHDVENKAKPWKSSTPANHDRDEQRLYVTPIHRNTEFFFHVDFDNLLDAELDLLCFGLKPSNKFLHKIGLGKPLGLGSANVEILGILTVDRQTRYEKLSSPRYTVEVAWECEKWPERYWRELVDVDTNVPSDPGGRTARSSRHAEKLKSNLPAIHAALMFLGETQVKEDEELLINTPLTKQDVHRQSQVGFREESTYAWYADMYRCGVQRLPDLGRPPTLPLLASNDGQAERRR